MAGSLLLRLFPNSWMENLLDWMILLGTIFFLLAVIIILISFIKSIMSTSLWQAIEQKFTQIKLDRKDRKSAPLPQIEKELLGISLLENICSKQLTTGISICVEGSSRHYLRLFGYRLLKDYLANGKERRCIYINTLSPPRDIIDEIKTINGNKEDILEQIHIIDSYIETHGRKEEALFGLTCDRRPWSDFFHKKSKRCTSVKGIEQIHSRIRNCRLRVFPTRKDAEVPMDANKVLILNEPLSAALLLEEEDEIVSYLHHEMPLNNRLGWVDVYLCLDKANGYVQEVCRSLAQLNIQLGFKDFGAGKSKKEPAFRIIKAPDSFDDKKWIKLE